MDKEHNSSDTIESFCKNERMIISKNMKNVLRKPFFVFWVDFQNHESDNIQSG